MTRLAPQDIASIPEFWPEYARRLHKVTGSTLIEICAAALGKSIKDVKFALYEKIVRVVPISTGQGLIEGFDKALMSVASYLGCKPVLMPADSLDLSRKHADSLLIWADDNDFYSENMLNGSSCENGWATGAGFAAVLEMMAKKNGTGKKTLVLGTGPVGKSAASFLVKRGFNVFICDIRKDIAVDAARKITGCSSLTPEEVNTSCKFDCLLDASPTNTFFPVSALSGNACVSAPCVPCGWLSRPELNVWHDPLQLGTAVMLAASAISAAEK